MPAIAHDDVELPELPSIAELTLKSTNSLDVKLSVDAVGLVSGIVKVVFMLRELFLTKPGGEE